MTRYIITAWTENLPGTYGADWFRDKSIFDRTYKTIKQAEAAAIENYLGPDCDGHHARWEIEKA
jgi:hypothetical protein